MSPRGGDERRARGGVHAERARERRRGSRMYPDATRRDGHASNHATDATPRKPYARTTRRYLGSAHVSNAAIRAGSVGASPSTAAASHPSSPSPSPRSVNIPKLGLGFPINHPNAPSVCSVDAPRAVSQ